MQQNPIQAPIQVDRGPTNFLKAPIVPCLVVFPMTISIINMGTAQTTVATKKAMRNGPPSLAATTRGKRQILPAPKAMPIEARIKPTRLLQLSFCPAMLETPR